MNEIHRFLKCQIKCNKTTLLRSNSYNSVQWIELCKCHNIQFQNIFSTSLQTPYQSIPFSPFFQSLVTTNLLLSLWIYLLQTYCVCVSHFSCLCVHVSCSSCVRLFATPWTVACQALLSMGFSRQEYWNGLPLTFLYKQNQIIYGLL